MSLFDSPAPRWFTIAPHRPFLEDLAAGLLATLGADGPEALADAVVLTPTRRGARALAEAFVKVGEGRAVLLPQIRAIGDLDEGEPPFEPGDLALDLPPAITPGRRRFELARLVADHAPLFDRPVDATYALETADALATVLDSLQIEEIEVGDRFETLVEEDFAEHWKRSAEVLRIATRLWPERLAELGLVDVNARRTALLRGLAEQWRRNPPDRPLIAAGSTGTAPAAADLLAVIAAAPKGAVVLPGLDKRLAESAWADVGEDHPQGAMRRLLQRAGVSREAVSDWPSAETAQAARRGGYRERLLNEALRPAEATDDWLHQIDALRSLGGEGEDPIAEALQGLSLVSARTEEEAAVTAAILLRETLETPGRTAALITPDAAMARRVSARLARWGIRVDSSAGQPLAAYPAGVLLSLLAQAAADPMQPSALLAILKHPLVRLGRDPEANAADLRALERYGLRGARPNDWKTISIRLEIRKVRLSTEENFSDPALYDALATAIGLAGRLQAALDGLAEVFARGVASGPLAARTLALAAETLARDQYGDLGGLWAGAGGDAAASFVTSLIEDSEALPPLTARAFADLIESLLARHLVRTGGATHPRLHILGALEGRLVRADRLVLAGLEEGVWPRTPPVEPFLSRPMRARLDLPAPERRIGLAAHDFAQAASAPEVVLVTTERRGGQPAVRSRWLWRLETLARGADVDLPRRDDALAWARALDAPITPPPSTLKPAERPRPTPPVAVRPTELPVTRIETWVRDPYAVYARAILRLRPLDRPDAGMEAATRGSAIHAAFQAFADAWSEGAPTEPAALFTRLMVEALEAAGTPRAAMTRERVLAERLGVWAAEFERDRRTLNPTLLIEKQGRHCIATPGGGFTVTATADRIELVNGFGNVLDFKTGQPPTPDQVRTGFAPQLTLTAAILAVGGFVEAGAKAAQPGELLYVRAIGRRTAGEVKSAVHKETTAAELADAALQGLIKRVDRFEDAATPYPPRVAPQFLSQHGDYDHLSRLYEWHVMGEADEGEP